MTNIDYFGGLPMQEISGLWPSDGIRGYVGEEERDIRRAEPAVVFAPDGRINLSRSYAVNNPPPTDSPLQSEVIRFSAWEVEEYIMNKYPGYEIISIREPER